MTPLSDFQQAIEAFRSLPVESGRVSRTACGELFVMAAPWDPLDRPDRHLVTLGYGVPPRPAVQGLSCGLLSSGGELFSAHRTDRQGQFLVDLPQGSFRLRFVADVTDAQDVDILLRLGDDAARRVLEDRLVDDDVAAELQEYIRSRLQVIALAVSRAGDRWVQQSIYGASLQPHLAQALGPAGLVAAPPKDRLLVGPISAAGVEVEVACEHPRENLTDVVLKFSRGAAPVSGISVEWTAPGGEKIPVVTTRDGQARYRLPDGRHAFRAAVPGQSEPISLEITLHCQK